MSDPLTSEPSDPARGPLPVARPRLYEQVAQQIADWVSSEGLRPGDRLPPERELAVSLAVSRATVSRALVAMEVLGVVEVRHGDGVWLRQPVGTTRIAAAIRQHARRIPEVIEAREALETKIAALAAVRRTDADLEAVDAALEEMAADVEAGGRGVDGDRRFHAAVTRAAHSALLAELMIEISDLVLETRIESLSQPGRPAASLRAHRAIAAAIRAGDAQAAGTAMHDHVEMVSDVAWIRG